MKPVVVKQDAEKEVPVEILAGSIVAISQGIRKLRGGRLNDRALYLLIQHAAPTSGGKYNSTKVTIGDIRAVLEGIDALERTYIKKKSASV